MTVQKTNILCLATITALLALCAAKKGGNQPRLDTSDVLNPDPQATGPVWAEYNVREDLTEGDMMGAHGKKKGIDRNAVSEPMKLWPQGIVPYEIHSSIRDDDYKETILRAAIIDYKNFTCVKWVERTNEEDYVSIRSTTGGCFAWLGRSGGMQPINLGSGCWSKGTVIHEMLHTIGFAHEQSRGDRDNHIIIHYDNIPEGLHSQFDKMPEGSENNRGFGYDYSSVMHYGMHAFASDGRRPTITTRDPENQRKIGNRAGFSKQDVKEVNKVYQCANGQSKVPGVNGCMDKDRDYCQNTIGLRDGPSEICERDERIYNHCKVSCGACDPNASGGGGGGNGGTRPTRPGTPRPPVAVTTTKEPATGGGGGGGGSEEVCEDGEAYYCYDTLGLKNGPNSACAYEHIAEYCKKACGRC